MLLEDQICYFSGIQYVMIFVNYVMLLVSSLIFQLSGQAVHH